MVSNFADNIIAASRLTKNMIFANAEAIRTTIQSVHISNYVNFLQKKR